MELLDNPTIRQEASKAGLVFGTVSGGYIFLSQWLSAAGPAGSGVNLVLEAAKVVGLILLMRHFMILLSSLYEAVSSRQTLRFGIYTDFFSALITAACAYVAYAYVYPDAAAKATGIIYEIYGPSMDSNTRSALQAMENNFPMIAFASNFAWCFLYGTVLSLILSRLTAGRRYDIPSGTEEEDNQNENSDGNL